MDPSRWAAASSSSKATAWEPLWTGLQPWLSSQCCLARCVLCPGTCVSCGLEEAECQAHEKTKAPPSSCTELTDCNLRESPLASLHPHSCPLDGFLFFVKEMEDQRG